MQVDYLKHAPDVCRVETYFASCLFRSPSLISFWMSMCLLMLQNEVCISFIETDKKMMFGVYHLEAAVKFVGI